MRTNGVLTLSPFAGKPKIKKSVSRVYDKSGALIGGVTAYNVYDLNGEKIAGLSHVIQSEDGNIRRYEGYRVFHLKNGYLMLENGTVLGRVESKKDRSSLAPVFAALAILLAAILVIVCVLGFPEIIYRLPGYPEDDIVLEEKGGEVWSADKELEIFYDSVKPGDKGSYEFKLTNPTEYVMEYTISLAYRWSGDQPLRSPFLYSLEMNGEGVYAIGGADGGGVSIDNGGYLRSDLLLHPGSDAFTLYWEWPFESGNDDSDTATGVLQYIYYLDIVFTATLVGDES